MSEQRCYRCNGPFDRAGIRGCDDPRHPAPDLAERIVAEIEADEYFYGDGLDAFGLNADATEATRSRLAFIIRANIDGMVRPGRGRAVASDPPADPFAAYLDAAAVLADHDDRRGDLIARARACRAAAAAALAAVQAGEVDSCHVAAGHAWYFEDAGRLVALPVAGADRKRVALNYVMNLI